MIKPTVSMYVAVFAAAVVASADAAWLRGPMPKSSLSTSSVESTLRLDGPSPKNLLAEALAEHMRHHVHRRLEDQDAEEEGNGNDDGGANDNAGDDNANGEDDDAAAEDDAVAAEAPDKTSLIDRFSSLTKSEKIWTIVLVVWASFVVLAVLFFLVRSCCGRRRNAKDRSSKDQPLMTNMRSSDEDRGRGKYSFWMLGQRRPRSSTRRSGSSTRRRSRSPYRG